MNSVVKVDNQKNGQLVHLIKVWIQMNSLPDDEFLFYHP